MRRLLSTLLLVGACVAGGCGFGGDDEVTERVQQPALLTKAQVERHPKGSPARALFEWWRTVQYDNAVAAVPFYSDDLGLTAKKLDSMLIYGVDALGLKRRPQLVEAEVNGRRATVLVLLESKVMNFNGRVDTVRTARGFNFVREAEQWKLSDNTFLERGAELTKKLTELAARQQNAPQP